MLGRGNQKKYSDIKKYSGFNCNRCGGSGILCILEYSLFCVGALEGLWERIRPEIDTTSHLCYSIRVKVMQRNPFLVWSNRLQYRFTVCMIWKENCTKYLNYLLLLIVLYLPSYLDSYFH